MQGDGDAHPVAPNDVVQGQLEDCYLLAALAAVAATDPDWIQQLVVEEDDGCVVRLAAGRAPVRVQAQWLPYRLREGAIAVGADEAPPLSLQAPDVDAEVPALELQVLPAFAQLADRVTDDDGVTRAESWVLMVELACASLARGYDRLEQGSLAGGMTMVGPVRERARQWTPAGGFTTTTLGSILRTAHAGRRPLTLGTRRAPRHPALRARHAYALLGTDVRDGEPLAILHDPWGTAPLKLSLATLAPDVETVCGAGAHPLLPRR